jgi:RHS repeat-associated protein/uncharacterized repeat protein (TIGR01451 family)
MKKSKGMIVLTCILLLLSSMLTLFTAGCINYGTSTKAVDLTEAPPGETLTYTLIIINSGDEPSTNTVVSDTLSQNLENVGNISGGGVYNSGTRTITWNLGTFPANGRIEVTFTADIIPSTPAGTVVQNTASITYTGGGPLSSNTVQTTVTAPDPLDHFEFAPISSPQVKGQPFPVTIYAKDSVGQTVEAFEGTADLSDLTGTITPNVTRSAYSAIEAGAYHSLGVDLSGSLTGWGNNDQGQASVPVGSDYVAVSGGANHSLALKADGTLAGWGFNNQGQATPPSGNDFVAVAAGGFHSLALRSDGSLLGWGENFYGQANVPTGNDFVAVSAGYYYSVALRSDGSITAWGVNNEGQLNVPSGNDYITISAGAYHGLALKTDGSLVGWGYNSHGQTTVPSGNDFIAISGGQYHSLALRSDGSLMAWGYNGYGQTSVPAGNDFVEIAAGDQHCLALRSDGYLAAWGYNGYGQTNVPQGDFTLGVFNGFVNIGAPHASDTITVECNEKTGTSNTFEVMTLSPDLSTSYKDVDLAEIIPQSVLNYGVHVFNTGAGEATQTVVTDYLDANLEDISGITGRGVYNPIEHKITWDLGILESQAMLELGFTARVIASASQGTIIDNQAQIDCVETGAFTTNTVQSVVIAGSADHFGVIAPASAFTGQPFEVTLTALDSFGHTVTGYQGTVLLTTSGTGTLDPAQATFSAGMATLQVAYSAAESIVITATDSENPAITGQSGTIAVEATISELAISAIAPCISLNDSVMSDANVTGSGFQIGAELRLEKGEDTIVATDVIVSSDSLITCTLDLTGVDPGLWDVVIENPDLQIGTRPCGFRVVGFKGPLSAWGNNDSGQNEIPIGSEFVAVSTGGNHSLALLVGGSIAAWGLNEDGQATAPQGNDYIDIAAGGYHSLALCSDGSIIAWGRNDYGQTDVPAGNNFVAVAAGWNYSLALRSDGSLAAWGDNSWGQTSVPVGNDFTAISAGGYHAIALHSDSSIESWGNNTFGQMDNLPQGNDFTAISAGGFHSLALRTDNSVYAWGNNSYGQADAPAGNDFTAISAGGFHSLGLRTNGAILAWGYNVYGQTDVPDGTFNVISAGGTCSLAIAKSGLNYFLLTAPESAIADQPFPLTITACDIQGSVVTGYEGTVLLTTSGTGTLDPTQATFSAGVATLQVTYSAAEEIAITATDSEDPRITGQSGAVVVAPAEAEYISIDPETLMVGCGETHQFTISCTDIFGNPVPLEYIDLTVQGGIGEVDEQGLLTTTATGIGSLTASYGSMQATADISVVTLIDETNLTADTTWTSDMNPIVIDHLLFVDPGVSLQIGPGVVIKFMGAESGIIVEGSLDAIGELENRITFTSISDDSLLGDTALDGVSEGEAGDWLTLGFINTDVSGNVSLDYCDILYSGSVSLEGPYSAIFSVPVENNVDGVRTFDHCTVRSSASAGAALLGGSDTFMNGESANNAYAGIVYGPSAHVSNCVIEDNGGDGMYGSSFEPEELLSPTITGNTLRNNGGYAIYAGGYTVADSIAGNHGYGNDVNGIVFSGLSNDSNWSPTNIQYPGEELPYVFEGNVDLGEAALTLQPGTVVKFIPGASLVASALNAAGTETQQIVFTSAKDSSIGGQTMAESSPAPGDWGSIRLLNSAASSISNCSISYGGGAEEAAVLIYGGSPSISSFSVSYSQAAGMLLHNSQATLSGGLIEYNASGVILANEGAVSATLASCQIRDNNGDGIVVRPSCSNLTISGNIISTNDGRGISLEDPVEPNPISQVTISDNTLEGNGGEAIYLGVNNANDITGSRGHGNGVNGICVTDFRVDTAWNSSNILVQGEELAYVVSEDIIHLTEYGEVPPDANMSGLSLEPGAVVKVAEGKSVSIARLDINKDLVVGQGDEAYITSIHDDQIGGDSDSAIITPSPGDWGSFFINAGTQPFSAAYGVIRYGGGSENYSSMLGITASSIQMDHCMITDSTASNSGASMIVTGEAIINGSVFSNHCYNPGQNTTAGLLVLSVDENTAMLAGRLSISDSQFLNNGTGIVGSLSEITIAASQINGNYMMGGSLTTSVNANVHTCSIDNNGIGLAVVGSGEVQIDACSLNGNVNTGIMLTGDTGEPLGPELNASVSGSVIEGSWIGLYSDSINDLNVSNNGFQDNYTMQEMDMGDGEPTLVYFGVGMMVSKSSGVVQGNTLLNQYGQSTPMVMTAGIQATDSGEITISENSLSGHMAAIVVGAEENPDATYHILSNVVESCSGIGVSTAGGRVTAESNTAFSCGYAPYWFQGSTVLSMPANLGSGGYWNGRVLIDSILQVQTITNDNPELPLLIGGTCSIPNALTVEPGTITKFLPAMESSGIFSEGGPVEAGMLSVEGAITATAASSAERIIFTSVRDNEGGDSNPGEGETYAAILDWRGVSVIVADEAASRVTFCDFRYADIPLKISGNPDPASNNGQLHAPAFVDDCRFENNGNGLCLDYCYLYEIGMNEETVAAEHMHGVKYRGARFANCQILASELDSQPGGIPYIFAGLMEVPAGYSLTLDADVIIKFDIGRKEDNDGNPYDLPSSKLSVLGYFLASGGPDKGIVFTSIKDDSAWGDSNPGYVPAPGENAGPATDDWFGIELWGSQQKIISNCRLSYAHHGIHMLGAKCNVSYCDIHSCWIGVAANSTLTAGEATIVDNKIWNCNFIVPDPDPAKQLPDGDCIWLHEEGNLTVSGNECFDSHCGIMAEDGCHNIINNDLHDNTFGMYANRLDPGAVISDNRVYANTHVGIDIINSDCFLTRNEIGLEGYSPPPGVEDKYFGLYIHQTEGDHTPVVTKNVVQYNKEGIYITGDSQPVIYANLIQCNTEAGVVVDNPNETVALYVKLNVENQEKFRGNDILDNDDFAVLNKVSEVPVLIFHNYLRTLEPKTTGKNRISEGVWHEYTDVDGNEYTLASDSQWEEMLKEERDLGYDNYCGFHDTVNTSTGNLVKTYTDMDIPGLIVPLKVTRTYNSLAHENDESAFGFGWSFSFGAKLKVSRFKEGDPASQIMSVSVTWEDGKTDVYNRLRDGSYLPPLGVTDVLIQEGDHWTVVKQDKTSYRFNDKGKLLYAYTPNSNLDSENTYFKFEYDEAGQVLLKVIAPSTDANSRREFNIEWTSFPNPRKPGDSMSVVTRITDSYGMETNYLYDQGKGVLVRVNYGTDQDHCILYGYDDHGRLGNVSQLVNSRDPVVLEGYTYNDETSGKLSEVRVGENVRTKYSYDYENMCTTVQEFLGNGAAKTDKHHYDSLGRIRVEEHANGTSTTYDYNHDSQCAHIVDPRGAETSMEHLDSLIMRKVEPSGAVTEYSYYPESDPVRRKLLRDETYSLDMTEKFVNRYFYDEKGNLVEAEYAIPQAAYDPAGYSSGNDAGLKEIKYDYTGNTMGQPTTIVEYLKSSGSYQASKVTLREYNIHGDLTREEAKDSPSGPTSSLTVYEYDSQGRLIHEWKQQDGSNAQEKRLSYVNDGISRFKPVTEYISHHKNIYDLTFWERRTTAFYLDGQVKQETSAELGYFNGEAFTVSDSCHMVRTEYSYHMTGYQVPRMQEKTTYGPKTEDGHGNLLPSDELERRRYTWHLNGLPAAECLVVGGSETNTMTYGYDALFRESARTESVTYAIAADSLETRQVVTTYAYDNSGNKTLERPPGSGKGTEKEYDLAGKVTTEIDPAGAVKRYEYDFAGNLVKEIIEKQGGGTIETAHTYDALSRETSVTRPNPANQTAPIVTTYAYGVNAKTATTTSQGQQEKVIDYTYDSMNRLLTEAKHYEGGTATTVHSYDWCGNETYLAEPGQPAKTKSYDLAGRLLKTTAYAVLVYGEPAVNLTLEEYAYDPAGRKSTSTTPYGSTNDWDRWAKLTAYLYDGLGRELRVVQELEGDEAVTAHAWEYLTDVTGAGTAVSHTTTSPEGPVSITVVDQRGREMRKTLSAGGSERTTWTAITEYSTNNAYNVKTEIAHGPAADNETTTRHDAAGRVIQATDATGGETTKAYNERGLVTLETTKVDSDTTTETFHAYDDLSRETMTCRGYNGEDPIEPRYFAYDIFGRKTSEWDAVSVGSPATFSYNLLDHLTVEARPIDAGNTLVKTYDRDEAGKMKSLTLSADATPVREIAYSSLGVPLRVISRPSSSPADNITCYYTWDAGARMVSETDGAGEVWSYTYNHQGLLKTSRDPLGNETTLTYDREGKMTASTVSDGVDPDPDIVSTLEITYTPMGEVESRTFSDPTQQPEGESVETYAYDSYGRLTSVSSPQDVSLTYDNYDAASRPQALTYAMGGKTYTETLTYTPGGALASVTLPAGQISYGYNDQGRLAHTESPTGAFYRYYYDSRGLPQTLTLPAGGEMDYSYTLDGRSESIALTPDGVNTAASLSFSYDFYGKVDSMERQMDMPDPASGAYAYAYDRLGRLTAADSPGEVPDYAYTYDRRGPVKTKTETPPAEASATVTYAYNTAGRLTSDTSGNTYAYDAAGRMTQAQGPRGLTSLAWDGLSRLTCAETPSGEITYAYDNLGRMLAREQADGTTTETSLSLPFAQSQEAAAVYDPAGAGSGTLLYSFVCGPSGTHLSQTDYTQDPDAVTYPFRSPRGDVLALASEDGSLASTYAYEPYGEMEEGYAAEGTPFLYQDDYRDPATDLYQMQARWYDPQAATFTSTDPALGDASDPMLRYPYAYCAGDPVYNSDPSGRRLDPGGGTSSSSTGSTIVQIIGRIFSSYRGRSGNLWSAIIGISLRRAEAKSERSSWPLIDVKPRTRDELNSIFIPDNISDRFGETELFLIRTYAFTTSRQERLDPFMKLFGIEKNGGTNISEFLQGIAGDKEGFKRQVQANFVSKLTAQEQMVALTFYNPLTKELDIEKFGAVSEYCMMREMYDFKHLTEESWAGKAPVLGWLFRKVMTPAKWIESSLTTRAINSSYGTTTLRKLWNAAQMMNYAVVEPNNWQQAAQEITYFGDSPNIGGILQHDPVYERFKHTVLANTADWASELYKVFYRRP